MAQGLWDRESPFLQLPGVNADKLKEMNKKLKDCTFEQFLRKSPKERSLLKLFDEAQEKQVEKAIKVFPLIDVVTKAFVAKEGSLNDPVVMGGDLLTIEVTIKLPNLPKNKTRGYIHSNCFPFMRKDNFVVLLTNADGSRVLGCERLFFH
jgi:hypothetical protein